LVGEIVIEKKKKFSQSKVGFEIVTGTQAVSSTGFSGL
jgi:hypothetical protein